jgi:ubiquinone biosynthesis protein COQ9
VASSLVYEISGPPASAIHTTIDHHNSMASKARVLRLRPLVPKPCSRSYHSYDYPPPPGPFNAVEESILAASIPHVPSHGFTQSSLSLGAKEAGYIDASTNLFPRGSFSLVHYHLYKQRLALAQHKHILEPSDAEQKPLGTGAKVKALTWERLMANKEIIHRWQEVSLISSPIST